MIRLQRDREAVPAPFLGASRETRVVELFRAAAAGTLSDKEVKRKLFSSTRWKASKNQLVRETYGKCAFCESPTSGVYYGDVEHFRPKASYWWLAYCYDNYLYSCRVCNGSKGEKHRYRGQQLPPPALDAGATDAELLALAASLSPSPDDDPNRSNYDLACLAEQGALPNPYQEDPEPLFEWLADEDLEEVTIVAAPNNPRALDAHGAVVEIVRLNRPELRTQRWQQYRLAKQLLDLSTGLEPAQRTELENTIRSLADLRLPFSAMMRFYNRKWGLLP